MNSALSPELIASLRAQEAMPISIEIVAETGSTNADLLARIDELNAPLLRIAEAQTAGRGRAGRTWHSAPGASLTFSLAWRFARPLAGLAALPLAVGVAICEALSACGVDARLKWPNDVLKDGRKLAGVLIETARRGNAIWAVIGVGINLVLPDSVAAHLDAPAAQLGKDADRNAVMARLLDALCDSLALFDERGFEAFASRWNRLHAFVGEEIVILDAGQVRHEGIAREVDGIGRLLIETADGMVAVAAGDVSLRLAPRHE